MTPPPTPHSSFNSVNVDTSNAYNKFLLYSQFVTWYYKGSSIAPFSDYAHNPTFQELPTMSQYFTNTDEKVFIDLRHGKGYTNELEKINRDYSDLSITITLKAGTTKKWDCEWLDTIKTSIYTRLLMKDSQWITRSTA